jgi:hypothetical protein
MTKSLRFGLLAGVVVFLLLQASPQAVGTITTTTTILRDLNTIKYSMAWVSDGSGNVSGNVVTLSGGFLVQIKFIPDGGGTAPTALYDVVLVDSNGVDYLAGAGANLSATVSNIVRPAAPLLYDATSTLDLQVSNAGAAKGGTVRLWFQQTQ